MKTTEQATTNDLRFERAALVGRRRLAIKVRLNDKCRNGHEDFSLTADIDEKAGNGKWVEAGGGCCHEEILAARPEFAPFAALHLCDSNGVPMHAFGNAFYWFAGFNGGLGQEYHGSSGRDGRTAADCRRIFAEHLRVTEAEVDAITAAAPRTEREMQIVCEDIGLPARWKSEAEAAIRQLEEWTGKKFASQASRPTWTPATPEERKQMADRRASGYYEPAQVAARDAAKAAERKARRLADIRADHAKTMANAAADLAVALYLAERFEKPNVIYYTHSNTLAFNWSNLNKLHTRAEFEAFVSAADLAALPQDIKFEFNEKPKH